MFLPRICYKLEIKTLDLDTMFTIKLNKLDIKVLSLLNASF